MVNKLLNNKATMPLQLIIRILPLIKILFLL